MKKLLIITMLFISAYSSAELPSWGMTENQYKLPNFNSKMNEIGKQAANNNWLLKITAPKDWHRKIQSGLTNTGARDVQVNFKDSLYQSISITAAPGLKLAKVSSGNDTSTVQKQVVIDKPDIDTGVEAPEFGDIKIESNTNQLLENIGNMDIAVPKPTADKQTSKTNQVTATNVVNTSSERSSVEIDDTDLSVQEIKEILRKRHARSKRVERVISFNKINNKDELFVQGQVVLVKRFVNQGVVLYFWMKEAYDPAVHQLIEKGSGKYELAEGANTESTDEISSDNSSVAEELVITNLDFVAVDTDIEAQDELRKDYARNKKVDVNITANQLKEDDLLYVKNNTVMVERPITRSQSAYFWLIGETAIPREVERKDDNQFKVL